MIGQGNEWTIQNRYDWSREFSEPERTYMIGRGLSGPECLNHITWCMIEWLRVVYCQNGTDGFRSLAKLESRFFVVVSRLAVQRSVGEGLFRR